MAYKNLKQYSCGGCGCQDYSLYHQEENRLDLFAECQECKSITIISATLPIINLEWGEGADGMMCIMPGE
jgi:hypothetical protein